MSHDYGSIDYWNHCYSKETNQFDWFFPVDDTTYEILSLKFNLYKLQLNSQKKQ
jgi:hypothetical protein